MNITMNQHEISAAPRLNGKVSLITGSTSGIGLGIARALAAAGSAVVLNGFGKPEEIHATQATIKSEFGVPVVYSPADIRRHRRVEENGKHGSDEQCYRDASNACCPASLGEEGADADQHHPDQHRPEARQN
jgi:hypothetical protein